MSDYGVVYNVFFMLGGIAVLLFGIKLMGSNLEKAAGNNLKKMFRKITNNKFAGVGVGAAVTAIINSSAATTVMLVGFVNIGVMTLTQATTVIMGANIGTTITAQIMSLTGLNFDVNAIAALVAAVGAILALFFGNEKVKRIGNIMFGVGMIFIGLKIMSNSVNFIIYDENNALRPVFEKVFSDEIFPLLLVLIGIIFTALVQSSAAITGILIALAGALRLDTAIFVILGSNIGTCVTALISSIGTSTNAKRTAIIHLLFNFFGCFIVIIPVWIWKAEFVKFMQIISGSSVERQIANFHTLFNVLTTLLLLPFTKVLVKLATKIVPDSKADEEKKKRLTFLDERLLQTPPIAAAQVKKEIIKMAQVSKVNIGFAKEILLDKNFDRADELKENEELLNYLNANITAFLSKILAMENSYKDEKMLSTYFHVVSDIERVGDYCENLMEYAVKLRDDEMALSDDAQKEINEVIDTVNSLYDCALEVFETQNSALLKEVDVLEESIDKAAKDLENKHIERVKKNRCTAAAGSVFLQTVSDLERIGDHITNIAFSINKYY